MPEQFSSVSQSNGLLLSLCKKLPSFNQAWQALGSMFFFNQALQAKAKPIAAPSLDELPNLNQTNLRRFDMLHRPDDFVPPVDQFGIRYEADMQWFNDYVLLSKHDHFPTHIQADCRCMWDSYLQLTIVVLPNNDGYLVEDPDDDDWIYAKDDVGLKAKLAKLDNYWLRNNDDVKVNYNNKGQPIGYSYKGLTDPEQINWLISLEITEEDDNIPCGQLSCSISNSISRLSQYIKKTSVAGYNN